MFYNNRIARCASLLADECRTGSFGRLYGHSLTLALMTALFARSLDSHQTSRYGLARWQHRRAIECFEAYLPEEITLADVANQLGLSQSRLARGFRLSTAISQYRWLTEARIKKAWWFSRPNEPIKCWFVNACAWPASIGIPADGAPLAASEVQGMDPGGRSLCSARPAAGFLARYEVHSRTACADLFIRGLTCRS